MLMKIGLIKGLEILFVGSLIGKSAEDVISLGSRPSLLCNRRYYPCTEICHLLLQSVSSLIGCFGRCRHSRIFSVDFVFPYCLVCRRLDIFQQSWIQWLGSPGSLFRIGRMSP